MARYNYRRNYRRGYGNRYRSSYGRRYYPRGRRYYPSSRRYVRTIYRGARRYQTRTNRGIGVRGLKFYPELPALAGFLIGLTNIDRLVPANVWLGASALPIGGSYGRAIRNGAGGVILGEMFSQATGKKINFPVHTKTNSVTSFYA